MYLILLILGAALWVFIGYRYLNNRASSMFHPATYYLLVHGLIFVIRPIFGYIYDFRIIYGVYQFTPSMSTKLTVLAAADLGLICFYTSVMKVASLPLIIKAKPFVARKKRTFFQPFILTAVICLPIAAYSLRQAIATKASGYTSMLLDSSTGFNVNTSGNGYFNDAHQMLQPLTAIFAWQTGFKPWSLIPFVIYFIAGASTGSRGPVIIGAVALGLLYLHHKGRRWFTPSLLFGLLLVYGTFRIAGDDRGATIRSWFSGETPEAVDLTPGAPLENMDYANMEFFEYIVSVVPEKSRTYDYFLDNLQIFTEPVPRTLWPGKPVGAPIKRFELFKYGFPIGLTFSVPGEGWMQLGWAGVVIWCGFIGWLYGKLYNAFVNSKQTIFQTSLYLMILPQSITVFRDGVLLSAVKGSLFVVLPILVWKVASLFMPGAAQPRNQVRASLLRNRGGSREVRIKNPLS